MSSPFTGILNILTVAADVGEFVFPQLRGPIAAGLSAIEGLEGKAAAVVAAVAPIAPLIPGGLAVVNTANEALNEIQALVSSLAANTSPGAASTNLIPAIQAAIAGTPSLAKFISPGQVPGIVLAAESGYQYLTGGGINVASAITEAETILQDLSPGTPATPAAPTVAPVPTALPISAFSGNVSATTAYNKVLAAGGTALAATQAAQAAVASGGK